MFKLIYQYFKFRGWNFKDRMDRDQFENLYQYFLNSTIEVNNTEIIIRRFKIEFIIKLGQEPYITYPYNYKKFDWYQIQSILELKERK